MEKLQFLCVTNGNVKWYGYFGKQFGCRFQKLNIYLPYDTVILLFNFLPKRNENMSTQRLVCKCYSSVTTHASQELETVQMSLNW